VDRVDNLRNSFNCNLTNGLSILVDVYSTFGDINDILNEIEYYEQKGDKTKVKTAKKKADSEWLEAKRWMSAIPLEEVYSCLQTFLIGW